MRKKVNRLPDVFKERLQYIIPPSEYAKTLRTFSCQRSTSFRINTMKAAIKEVLEKLKKNNIPVEKVSWYKHAFFLKTNKLRDLQKLDIYKQGKIYIQSLSSMIPPLILKPEKGEKVLDVAAAPGSKTTQIAAMMENSGEIIANDTSPIRREKLMANLKNQGVEIAKVTNIDGRNIWQKYPEYFDKVLVDVPCSLEGRITLNDKKTYSNWSEKKIRNLSRLQKWILRSSISAVKVGGRVVYSTCTLAPEENEKVIDWIIKKEDGKIALEKISLIGVKSYPGLTRWKDEEFDVQVKKTTRIIPSNKMEGFFLASIRKVKSNVIT